MECQEISSESEKKDHILINKILLNGIFKYSGNRQVMNNYLHKHDASISLQDWLCSNLPTRSYFLAMLEIKGLARNISHFAFGNDFCTSFVP